MSKNKDRHMFLGGNTSKGFYSFFDNIISQEDATKIYCLKGGPGTGKSSLMKKIAFHFSTKGYNIEQFHCSSDDQSLDGVLIKELNVALLDGTAPHTIDPQTPGAIDSIVDLATCLNFEKIKPYKKDILSLNSYISNCFKRSYKYLNAASIIYKDWADLNNSALDKNLLFKFNVSLKDMIFPNCRISPLGKERHLFSTAFSPNGVVSYTSALAENLESIFILKGEPGLSKSEILKELGDRAIGYGYNIEYYHNPILPDRVSHLIIPELNTGIFSESEISKLSLQGTTFNLSNMCDKDKLSSLKEDIDFNKEEFEILLNKALSLITEAKSTHDKLEKFYVDNMDFDKVNEIYDRLVKEIEMLGA
ncbi:MAG: PRK06851 family protein [Clostridium sp.]|uniref:PRK06851 family protein n=1 Tax=Clostridium sp. TaxID=1506 RepID=UPI003F3F3722